MNFRFPDLDRVLRDFAEIGLALFQFRIGTHGHVADGSVVGRERLRNETFPPGTAGRSATVPALQSNRFPQHGKLFSVFSTLWKTRPPGARAPPPSDFLISRHQR